MEYSIPDDFKLRWSTIASSQTIILGTGGLWHEINSVNFGYIARGVT